MIEATTRLRVARGIGPTEREASEEVFQVLKQRRGHPEPPPPTVSDGWGGIREAMVEVYGRVPPYKGRGRPPTIKRPGPDWKYLQVIKIRDETGRVTGTRTKVIYGSKSEVMAALQKHTAYIERTQLTMRHMNSRLVRKGLGFSKLLAMHRAAAAWEDVVYNLTWVVQTLRVDRTGPLDGRPGRRWEERTPAMAAGLTDQVWSVRKLLRTAVPPRSTNT
jgi:hypothetical protein